MSATEFIKQVDAVIKQVEKDASEWLEHAENPDAMVSGILASKIVGLNDYINYLEKRLQNDSSGRVRVN